MNSATTTKRIDWRNLFGAALNAAASKADIDISALKWEDCTTDQTWGDRCGLVFWGAAPEVNERAAKFWFRSLLCKS